jgi:hypothetical protein
MEFMSVSSYKNYFDHLFPKRIVGPLFILAFSLATSGCLGDGGDGNPKCAPQAYNKVITPSSYADNHAYFPISDFDFLFQPNLVIQSITLQGTATGHHVDQDRDDDFDMDVNGTKTSRSDGDRHVHWNCGSGDGPANSTSFCTALQGFSLNGGDAILDFMTRVQIQHGNLRVGFKGGKSSSVSNLQLVVAGTLHPISCKPTPPPPPPPPVAPHTSITAENPNTSPTNSMTESITFSADQTGVQFACSLDGATATACTSPQLYSGLSNGTHIFKVTGTNAAGLSDATPPTYTWVVDTTPPTVTITNAANLPTLTNATTISVQFAASEAATFSCVLDGSTAQTCTSPFAPTGLGEGPHTISISAVDAVGNVSATAAVYQWTIDLTPPVTTINLVTPSAAINNSTQMSFQFSANETSTFACSIDNGAYSTCQSPVSLNNVMEGSHWFSVRATDVAGNLGAAVTYSWKADFTPPLITLNSSVPAAGPTNAHTVSVDFALSEPATVTCSLDGATPAPCTSPFTALIATEGPHSVTVAATDVAGNNANPLLINWTMDFTKPILSFGTILPSAAAIINSPNISLEILASKAVTMTATLNGSPLGAITSPLQLNGLAEGSYTVVISAVDMVGNLADSLTYSFSVDLTPPTLTLSAAITGLTNLDSNTLTFSANEASTFACNVDEAGFGACQSPLALSGLADGVHTVLVHATDVAGNVSPDSSVQWTVDTTPPTTTLSVQQNGLNSYTFTITSNEANSTFLCSADGATAQACTSPFTLSGLSTGVHSFFAQAIDAAGNIDNKGASYNFTIIPPTTTLTHQQTANAAITFTFSSNVTGATFTCSLDSAVETACTSPLSLTGFAAGQHTFLARAHDQSGNADPTGASFTWTVRPPVTTTLNSENPASADTNHTSMTFTFSASQSDATFVCSLNGAAATACASPITYSGLTDGAKTFKVQAVDIWGTVDPTGASYAWTVDTVPPGLVSITTSSTSTSITVNWTTTEVATTKLFWGVSPSTANVVPEDSVYVTTHSVHVTGLSPNTLYTVKPAGTDVAGNGFVGGTFSVRTGH